MTAPGQPETVDPVAEPADESGPNAGRPASGRRRPGVEGLGALVGGGGSQVGTNGAMRARDVSRPR